MAHTHGLPGELNIYAVGALRAQFQSWVKKLPKGRKAAALDGMPLVVDGSAVAEVDAAGLQLLVALKHALVAKQRDLRVANASATLALACDTLGLNALLDAPESREADA
jgi:anti-anti-sigma regulatory factor